VAQQDAERQKWVVEKADKEREAAVIRAEGEAEAAQVERGQQPGKKKGGDLVLCFVLNLGVWVGGGVEGEVGERGVCARRGVACAEEEIRLKHACPP
jgi:hypothetical protein